MGSKGGSSAPAPPPVPDNSGQEMQMLQMMQAMMALSAQNQHQQIAPPIAPALPATPNIVREPAIDWKQKQEDLKKRVAADYVESEDTRRGTTDTILTSSLLDDETPLTTGSLLADDEDA